MGLRKICDCGGKQIEISADTKVELRETTRYEMAKFTRSFWKEEFLIEIEAWEKLCGALMKYKYIDKRKIISRFIDKSLAPFEEKEEYKKYLSRGDGISIGPIKDAETGEKVISLFCQEYRYYEDEDTGRAVSTRVYIKCGELNFPTEYKILLDEVETEIREKKLQYPPRKRQFSKKLKPGKYDFYLKDLQTAIESNKDYFNRFKKFVANPQVKDKVKIYDDFIEKAEWGEDTIHVLDIEGELFFEYICGFDIEEKYNEIKSIIFKLSNTNDAGEGKVDYAIKWCVAELGKPVVEIKRNCESKYRYNCILLAESSFIDEAQEYDHILVCDAGIILIETKNWSGRVEIRPDGKWLRNKENGGPVTGIESPAFQLHRHEMLLKQILPNVPVYSILCFSNSSVILDGIENFSDFPVVYIEKLKDKLSEIILSGKNIEGGIDYMVNEIEKHKVHIMVEENSNGI